MGTTWQRSGPLAGPANAAMYDVVAFGAGFVGVGGHPVSGSLVWCSSDGIAWTLVQPADIDEGGGMISVVALPDRLVAVGRLLHAEPDTAAAWVSPDGGVWRRVDGGPAFDGAQILRAIPHGSGLIAVGSDVPQDAGVVWLSPDGATWERVEQDGTFDRSFPWSVARVGERLVAGGWRRTDGADRGFAAAIWSSLDGRTWDLQPPLPGGEGRQVRSIAVGEGGTVVAVGDLVDGGGAAAWRSSDGVEWIEVPDPTFTGAALVTVVAGGPGFVAGGTRGAADAGIWTSVDGSAWSPVALDILFQDAYVTSVLATPTRLVAGGALQRQIPGSQSYETTPVAWVSAGE